MSHIDIATPLGTNDHAAPSTHWGRGTAILVGAWCGPNVWRISFEGIREAATNTVS